ncbi:eukaryotic translation initiation factor 2 alpha subunit-domain-containing protein [Pelagophyceae sp. CCMP2097]|nr:eukaryotic translation initiation factor 2 alpha subunit-domain-containing protein [Pelagophyceae sp. CCMP2097]|mmetsp:Transcript_2605/g.7642  ORF Transcript_2605/g.7642 Transcript_2605/m.7642 type:complete len:339 (-) Transcript_2605:64-1080(-)
MSDFDTSKRLECRFYEDNYPEIESLVMVNVRNIAEMGAYVTLLEYNNIEGMILLSELSRRRIRSINKLIRVNRNEVVMVLRVDKEKGYIDLSKRRVSAEDVVKCEDRYNKAKAVHRVMRHVAEKRSSTLEELYQAVGWPLYKKYGHAYDAFKLCLTEHENIFDHADCKIDADEETKACLVDYIKKKLSPQPIKVRADVEVTCFTYEGINAIRAALMSGQAASTPECPITIKLIAPPLYVMTTMTLDKELGVSTLAGAITVITATILEKGGRMDVKMAPKVVSAREETELQAMMDRLAAENAEVEGDDDEEDSDGGGDAPAPAPPAADDDEADDKAEGL